MFKYNVSNDKVLKIVRKWCKANNHPMFYDDKNKDVIYPLMIDAPSKEKSSLEEYIVSILERE